jgi:hypothetical protein
MTDHFLSHFIGTGMLTKTLLILASFIGLTSGALAGLVEHDHNTTRVYPLTPFVVDVTKSPYFAKGDGVTDVTDVLQRAIDDCTGRRMVVFLPTGTYLISRSLEWKKRVGERENWGFTTICGEHQSETILRLKNATFTDATQPHPMMSCGGFGSADWFHNYVENMTFDVGRDNPGATALQFYSNNSGAVRDCRFIAGEGSGYVGLDLSRDMNGPLLVQNIEVVGFQKGIAAAGAVNSQTFENITLRGQREVGLDNAGQSLSIRHLKSENSVIAIRTYGSVCLLDSKLTGLSGAENVPAVINYNSGRIFLRDIATSGYSKAIGDVESPDFFAAVRQSVNEKPGLAGPVIKEYCSHPTTAPFGGTAGSLRLEIQEPPMIPQQPVAEWANVDSFGADPTGSMDSASAIQQAIDSGAQTIFLPGSYRLTQTVIVRGAVRRIIGLGGWLDYNSETSPDLRIEDGDSPVVIEQFASINGGMEINTNRSIVLKSVSDCDLKFTDRCAGGDLFFEDFVTHDLHIKTQNVWARQLNVENEGTHLRNEGGKLWVLGYKTERGGTLLETLNSGSSEILGNFSYTTTAGSLAPMFVTTNSRVFTFFGEVCFSGDPFRVLIQETQNDQRKEILNGDGLTIPYRSAESR